MEKLFKKFQSKRKRGFTLLEVLVVVIILGILAVIAIPTYNKVIRKSRVADGLNTLSMLANAQDKYFVENHRYADVLTDLKAPIKHIEGTGHDQTITTPNFTYSKGAFTTCLFATSKQDGYTLVKNFKTNSKTKCTGGNCSNISSYVEATDEELCPTGGDTCNLTEEYCTKQGCTSLNSEQCLCEGCLSTNTCELTLEKCIADGHTGFDSINCVCTDIACTDGETRVIPTSNSCSNSPSGKVVKCGHETITQICKKGTWIDDTKDCSNSWLIEQCSSSNINWEKCQCGLSASCGENSIGEWTITSEKCDNPSGSLEYSSKSSGGEKGSVGNGYEAGTEVKCAFIYVQRNCQDNEWIENKECRYKVCGPNQQLDDNCNCIDHIDCNESLKPKCKGGYSVCDPCPSGISIDDIIQQMQPSVGDRGTQPPNSNPTTPCYHCGYKSGSAEATCNYSTGTWYCESENNEDCTEVTGSVQFYGTDCDGEGSSGSKCGANTLSNVGCFQEVEGQIPELIPVYNGGCQLKTSSECWEGVTEECTTANNQQGTKTCRDCTWSECTVEQCSLSTKPEDNACGQYICNETTNYQWLYVFNDSAQCNPNWNQTELSSHGMSSCSSTCQATCLSNGIFSVADQKCISAASADGLTAKAYSNHDNMNVGYDYYDLKIVPTNSYSSCSTPCNTYNPGKGLVEPDPNDPPGQDDQEYGWYYDMYNCSNEDCPGVNSRNISYSYNRNCANWCIEGGHLGKYCVDSLISSWNACLSSGHDYVVRSNVVYQCVIAGRSAKSCGQAYEE